MSLQKPKNFRRWMILLAVSLALVIHLFMAGTAVLYYYYGHLLDELLTQLFNKKTEVASTETLTPQNDEDSVIFIRPENFVPQVSPPPESKIMDLAKPKNQTPPKKARFYSQHHSSTDQETTAARPPKNADPNKETHGGKQSPAQASKEKKQKSAQASSQDPKEMKGSTPGPKPDIFEKNFNPLTSDLVELETQNKNNEKKISDKKFVDLDVQPSDLSSIGSGLGRSFVEDFAPSVTIGNETILNTEQIKQVQYFTRMKRSFRLAFNPEPPLVSYFRGHRLDRGQVVVGMKVKVAANGRLSSLTVFKSSGIPGYDQSAISAVRKSSPLGSPPSKYLDPTGQLNMTWYFITYIR